MEDLRVLIVDDDDSVRQLLVDIFTTLGLRVFDASNTSEALTIAQNQELDAAFVDYKLPGKNGIELFQEMQRLQPALISIIITGHASIDIAVAAMQAGAWDFITKPVTPTILKQKIDRIKEISYLRREQYFRHRATQQDILFSGAIGSSPAMRPIYEEILRAAHSPLPVLIEGDTGTGKEYVAEAIHLNSSRKEKPFVIMDCTSTPESLFESVLFGSAKGAYTGAVDRPGLLDEADGGTLFLDEIGELSVEVQPKLLRCLETKRYRPVGKTKETGSDFRIICATNRNLKDKVNESSFRRDLFYRISAQTISLPPLIERLSDIPALVSHFLYPLQTDQPGPPVLIQKEALHKLQTHHWPGNIRQLKFVIQQAYFNRNGSEITPEDIQIDPTESTPTDDIIPGEVIDFEQDFKTFREQMIATAEKRYTLTLMDKTNGDVKQAAELAGMTREAFYRVLSRCKISPKQYRTTV